MKKYKATLYGSPIDLPAKKLGTVEIKHRIIPAGEEVIVVGLRQAMLRGLRPVQNILTEPLRIHELYEKKSMWMTDLPEELNQIGELMHNVQPQGRVLIGGLGLGILATTVASAEGVTDVVVVEKSRNIIKLCARGRYKTVHSDILKYLQTTETAFDYYLLDTWQGTSEGTWWTEVMPLTRAIRQRWGINPTIHCWAEDIMWGQIYRSLLMGKGHWYYTYLPRMNDYDAQAFLNMVGSKWWEREYGPLVDRYINETSNKRKHA